LFKPLSRAFARSKPRKITSSFGREREVDGCCGGCVHSLSGGRRQVRKWKVLLVRCGLISASTVAFMVKADDLAGHQIPAQ